MGRACLQIFCLRVMNSNESYFDMPIMLIFTKNDNEWSVAERELYTVF